MENEMAVTFSLSNPAVIAVFAPLLGFLVNGCFGTLIGKKNSGIIGTSLMGLSAFFAWMLYASVLQGAHTTEMIDLFTWISVAIFVNNCSKTCGVVKNPP